MKTRRSSTGHGSASRGGDGSVARPYAEAWQAILAGPVEAVARFCADPGEKARQMRQASPFAGVLDPRTRWSIWRRAREGADRR